MKERPILFSAPMVRALLDGSKTQTRRIVKDTGLYAIDAAIHGEEVAQRELRALATRCRYGAPGDQLWVREAFIHEPADYCWEASVSIPSRPASTVYRADVTGDSAGAGWSPSIHMPRRLSRITLEVTGVRVERLQDISEEDAKAEGCCAESHQTPDSPMAPTEWNGHTAVEDYAALWDSINGRDAWNLNPFVWVVEFRRVQP
jgi:hypothetical protein